MFTTANADFLVRERLEKLQTEIDHLHLNYLQTDQSLNKIDQRSKLESYIKELICLVSHEDKFNLQETPEVLHHSACHLDGFSAYGAASAWNAIANYAANLLSQPWRKEFRELKLYCGFFKHEIEANLLGAEILLEAMGYKPTDESTMVLDGPIDPDRISAVSRDALVAYVECQLLKKVWEDVSQRFECPWIDVLVFRENHIGSADHAARGIIYQIHHKQYLSMSRQYLTQQQQQQQQQNLHHHHLHQHHQRTLSTGYSIPTYGPGYYPYGGGYYTLPTPQSTALAAHPIASLYPSHQPPGPLLPPPPPPPPPSSSSPSLYAYASSPLYNMSQINPLNGYGQQSISSNTIAMTSVPTAQLIELAPPTPNSPPPPQLLLLSSSSSSTTTTTATTTTSQLSSKTTHKLSPELLPARPPADEGSGTFDSWDYVYRNLESQGYNKENIDKSSNHSNNCRTSSSVTTSSILTATVSQQKQHQVLSNPNNNNNNNNNNISNYNTNKKSTSTLQQQQEQVNPSVSKVNLGLEASLLNSMRLEATNRELTPPTSPVKKHHPPASSLAWQCTSCTFANNVDVKICVMCGKSKTRGAEAQPLISGGQECPFCTLVNPKEAIKCEACEKSLKGSPTYI